MDFIVPSQVYGTAGTPSGQLPVTRITTGQVAVGAPTLIAAADPLRKRIQLKINDLNTAAVGGPGVTTATGYVLDSTASNQPSEVELHSTGEIWADAVGKAVISFVDEGY